MPIDPSTAAPWSGLGTGTSEAVPFRSSSSAGTIARDGSVETGPPAVRAGTRLSSTSGSVAGSTGMTAAGSLRWVSGWPATANHEAMSSLTTSCDRTAGVAPGAARRRPMSGSLTMTRTPSAPSSGSDVLRTVERSAPATFTRSGAATTALIPRDRSVGRAASVR